MVWYGVVACRCRVLYMVGPEYWDVVEYEYGNGPFQQARVIAWKQHEAVPRRILPALPRMHTRLAPPPPTQGFPALPY